MVEKNVELINSLKIAFKVYRVVAYPLEKHNNSKTFTL